MGECSDPFRKRALEEQYCILAVIFSLYVKSQLCRSHVGDISIFPVGKPDNMNPPAPTIDSSLCLESFPTTGIFLIHCIPNMDCHCFLKAHESPCGGASPRPAFAFHHTLRMLLTPWGAWDLPPRELDKLWNVPSTSLIIIHGLRWHWLGLYLFYWHVSNICPL